jgi:hypothetical protein
MLILISCVLGLGVTVSSSGCKMEFFADCSAAGCNVTSRAGKYDSMTLRIGFSKCCKHLDAKSTEVVTQIYHSKQLDVRRFTVIFYHIGRSKDSQAEQLTANLS